jgi:hypothetical protein
MKKAIMALATAATVGFTALATTSPAEARWGGGWGPGIAGGLIAGAVIGGLASSAYGWAPATAIMDMGQATVMPPHIMAATLTVTTIRIHGADTPRPITMVARPGTTVTATAASFVQPMPIMPVHTRADISIVIVTGDPS